MQVAQALPAEGELAQVLIQPAAQTLEKALLGGYDLFRQALTSAGGQVVQDNAQQPPRSIAEQQNCRQSPAAFAARRTAF